MLAQVILTPGGVIAWLLVGLIAGWLAGVFMRGVGFGILADTVVGLIGAFVGGLLVSQFAQGSTGFWGSVLVAFIGACLCIGVVRAFSPRAHRI
jgi:uncharacterized membrane protein YeaQ/YmgE (transglycosylase-associated protein family)